MKQSQESQSDKFSTAVLKELELQLSERNINLIVDGNSIQVIANLCKYFLNEEGDIPLYKGIFMYGKIGCGKTIIMNCLQDVMRANHIKNYFPIMNCRTVVNEFNEDGFTGIKKYCNAEMVRTSSSDDVGKPIEKYPPFYLFDDLGAEQDGWHYGNKINVMSEIILSRYIYFQRKGVKTHITSNLGYDGDEIEKRYGSLFRSRIREMFTFIELTGEDKRK